MVALTILGFLSALVLGFIGGRNSMLKDVIKQEEEIESQNELICKMEKERDELRWQINKLNKRLLEETDGAILDDDGK